ncbi:MAG: redoxin domain-containing protein [Planctomycetia bacterium]|nr:MAG: redoxin domain-containing protein [Planctomycetia bacterium]
MHTRWSWTALALSLAVTSGAWAQLEKGSIAPDIEAKVWLNTDGEAISLQDTRGMITVLYFWVSFHEGGKYFFDDLNVFENSQGVAMGVRIIGLTSGEAKRTEPGIKKHKIFFPVGCESKADQDYRVEFWPYMVIVDPEGKVAWSGSPADGSEAVTTIRDILATNPPTRTHPKAAAAARSQLGVARAALQTEDYSGATRAARIALEKAMTGDTLKTHCQEFVDLLEALGRDAILRADRAVSAENWSEAVRQLRFVTRHFRGLDCYRTAKDKLDKLAKDHENVKRELGDIAGSEAAKADIKRARQFVEQRKFGEAYVLLEKVVATYPDSAEADAADALRGRLAGDARVMAEVTDYKAAKDCKEWISSARSYIAARRLTEARALLRRVLDEYPDSSFADEAMTELVRIQ